MNISNTKMGFLVLKIKVSANSLYKSYMDIEAKLMNSSFTKRILIFYKWSRIALMGFVGFILISIVLILLLYFFEIYDFAPIDYPGEWQVD